VYPPHSDLLLSSNLLHALTADSPSLKVNSHEAWKHYSIGPPYIVHKADLLKIANLWHDFVPRYIYDILYIHICLPFSTHSRQGVFQMDETSACHFPRHGGSMRQHV
jgi:hypothetical protein